MPVVGGIAGVGSALIGASSAKSAARAQSKAADQQMAIQKEVYEDTKGRFQPYENAGNLALQAYMSEMGLGPAPVVGGTAPQIQTITTPERFSGGGDPARIAAIERSMAATGNRDTRDEFQRQLDALRGQTTPASTTYRVGGNDFGTLDEARAWAQANPTGGTPYGGFTATPGYQFRVDQGNSSINALAGARGGLVSGRTMQDLASFNQGIASEEYSEDMNRLAGLTDMGMGAAGNQAQAANGYASGATNALANKGNAQAAGFAGVNNALQSGISNGIGSWMYQQGLSK